MDWDKLNDMFMVIGFGFAMISFGGLYLTSQISDSCIVKSLAFSVYKTTINATTLGNKLNDCQSTADLNKDFDLMLFGICGLTIPVVGTLLIAIIKKLKKIPTQQELITRLDALVERIDMIEKQSLRKNQTTKCKNTALHPKGIGCRCRNRNTGSLITLGLAPVEAKK